MGNENCFGCPRKKERRKESREDDEIRSSFKEAFSAA
jgi:hypothetical protein